MPETLPRTDKIGRNRSGGFRWMDNLQQTFRGAAFVRPNQPIRLEFCLGYGYMNYWFEKPDGRRLAEIST
jgi:hypothetical protein